MAKASGRAAWGQTFAVLAQLFNVNRDPEKAKAINPMQFYPWSDDEDNSAPPVTPHQLTELRQLFPKGGKDGRNRGR